MYLWYLLSGCRTQKTRMPPQPKHVERRNRHDRRTCARALPPCQPLFDVDRADAITLTPAQINRSASTHTPDDMTGTGFDTSRWMHFTLPGSKRSTPNSTRGKRRYSPETNFRQGVYGFVVRRHTTTSNRSSISTIRRRASGGYSFWRESDTDDRTGPTDTAPRTSPQCPGFFRERSRESARDRSPQSNGRSPPSDRCCNRPRLRLRRPTHNRAETSRHDATVTPIVASSL